jgi:hypothetical protein
MLVFDIDFEMILHSTVAAYVVEPVDDIVDELVEGSSTNNLDSKIRISIVHVEMLRVVSRWVEARQGRPTLELVEFVKPVHQLANRAVVSGMGELHAV